MTVEEVFELEGLDDTVILDNFEGPYWESCDDFISKNWLREVETLSEKQRAWLNKIVAECVRKEYGGPI